MKNNFDLLDWILHPFHCLNISLQHDRFEVLGMAIKDASNGDTVEVVINSNDRGNPCLCVAGEKIGIGNMVYICDCGNVYNASSKLWDPIYIWQNRCSHLIN